MQLIDIGANLTHDSFDPDRDAIIERAARSGVTRMIVTGASEQGSKDALALAKKRPERLFATVGVHPHHALDYSTEVHQLLTTLTKEPSVVAVGECGLDFFRNFSPRDAQQSAFEQQLNIAIESRLPVFLHQRDAHDAFVEILQPKLPATTRCLAHCFTGNESELRQYIEMDLYIGITGWICDERRGKHLHDIVSLIPDDRLMIETDAPYLLPRTLRPKPRSRRNEPAFLTEVLRVVAEARDQTEEQVATMTTANATRFFELPDA